MKSYPTEYLEFINLFNDEKFFEAHEVLEELWRHEKGVEREYYQGMIQIAAVFVHVQKKTPEGGKRLLQTSTKYLEKFQPAFMGINLEKLLPETAASLFEGKPFPRLSLERKSPRD